jgi:hypothetical protein
VLAALYPQEHSWYSFLLERLSQPQGHSAAGRIRSIEKSMDVIRNQARDHPACDILPELTTLLHAPLTTHTDTKLRGGFGNFLNLAPYRLGKMKLHFKIASVIHNSKLLG